jgi:hypothetical protein
MSTIWRPNTCGCELIFDHGPEQPPSHRTPCPDHLHATGLDVWNENRLLNRTLAVLVRQAGIALGDISWTYTPVAGQAQRTLRVTIHQPLEDKVAAKLPPGVAVLVTKP